MFDNGGDILQLWYGMNYKDIFYIRKFHNGTWFSWMRILTTVDLDELKSNFQVGVDTLYNACVAVGSTPNNSTPTAIATAIKNVPSRVGYFDKITTNSFDAIIGKRYIISFMKYGMSDNIGNTSGISFEHITLYGGADNGSISSWTVVGTATSTKITINDAIQYPQGMCVIRLN